LIFFRKTTFKKYKNTISFSPFLMKKPSVFLRKLNVPMALSAALLVAGFSATAAYAASTATFYQVINPGVLSVDIVDGSLESVTDPSIDMSELSFSFECQSSTGTFGTATEQIYVQNPFGANNGWTMTIAGSDPTGLWQGTDGYGDPASYDFNDPDTAGCADGGDSDGFAGLMTIDPSGGTVGNGLCQNCGTTGVSVGSSAAFEEGSVDSITILSGSAESDDVGDWTLQNVSIEQSIPPEQASGSDYSIELVLSVQSV
jgi:hypothetical protein